MSVNRKTIHAFTLIEIIAVSMALIITAVIFIPRLLGSKRRKLPTPISRIQADMRLMKVSIESYHVDYLSYPGHATGAQAANASHPAHHGFYITTFRHKLGPKDPIPSLTTPIAYCKEYPSDNYAGQKGITFGYYNASQENDHKSASWILWSPGPDKDYDINPATDYDLGNHPTSQLLAKTYDPTNGAKSNGDIWMAKEHPKSWVVRQ